MFVHDGDPGWVSIVFVTCLSLSIVGPYTPFVCVLVILPLSLFCGELCVCNGMGGCYVFTLCEYFYGHRTLMSHYKHVAMHVRDTRNFTVMHKEELLQPTGN